MNMNVRCTKIIKEHGAQEWAFAKRSKIDVGKSGEYL